MHNNKNNRKKNRIDNLKFDQILDEFKLQDQIDYQDKIKNNETKNNIEPSKIEIKKKLRNTIFTKNQMRIISSKKIIDEQTDEIKQMMKHPKITKHILEIYEKAMIYDLKNKLPKPSDIFDNTEHYKIEYYQYIFNLIKTMKEQNINIIQLDKLLDNPYSRYMSECIGCPLNPFNKL
jgi:hypothetical protein